MPWKRAFCFLTLNGLCWLLSLRGSLPSPCCLAAASCRRLMRICGSCLWFFFRTSSVVSFLRHTLHHSGFLPGRFFTTGAVCCPSGTTCFSPVRPFTTVCAGLGGGFGSRCLRCQSLSWGGCLSSTLCLTCA